nr:MAG TPA: hypothetical protein [Caudoviricetes sp.]
MVFYFRLRICHRIWGYFYIWRVVCTTLFLSL